MQTGKCSIIALLVKAAWLCLEQVSIAASMALTFCSTFYFGSLWTKNVSKKGLPQVLLPNSHFYFLDLGETQYAAFRTAMYYQKDAIPIIYLSWFWIRESWYEAGARERFEKLLTISNSSWNKTITIESLWSCLSPVANWTLSPCTVIHKGALLN